jgi:hypothetical protein
MTPRKVGNGAMTKVLIAIGMVIGLLVGFILVSLPAIGDQE